MYLTLDGNGELYRQLLRALRQSMADGQCTAHLPQPAVKLAHVTPSHQFPLRHDVAAPAP